MNNDGKFEFSYAAPPERERRKTEGIKSAHASKKEDKLEELRNLNKKVVKPPFVIGLTIGVFGALIMGIGLAMVFEWAIVAWGITLGIIGMTLAAASYPIYRAVLGRNKRKYGQIIIELSNELLSTQDERY